MKPTSLSALIKKDALIGICSFIIMIPVWLMPLLYAPLFGVALLLVLPIFPYLAFKEYQKFKNEGMPRNEADSKLLYGLPFLCSTLGVVAYTVALFFAYVIDISSPDLIGTPYGYIMASPAYYLPYAIFIFILQKIVQRTPQLKDFLYPAAPVLFVLWTFLPYLVMTNFIYDSNLPAYTTDSIKNTLWSTIAACLYTGYFGVAIYYLVDHLLFCKQNPD